MQYDVGGTASVMLRNYKSPKIGYYTFNYENEPYHFLKDVDVEFYFDSYEKTNNHINKTQYFYDDYRIKEVVLKNVPINEKILNLFFEDKEELFSENGILKTENLSSDVYGNIYFNSSSEKIYDIFLVERNGNIKMIEEWEPKRPYNISKKDTDFFVSYYEPPVKTFNLKRTENFYLNVDIVLNGNRENLSTIYSFHLKKCGVKIDRDVWENGKLISIDIKLILNDEDCSLSIK